MACRFVSEKTNKACNYNFWIPYWILIALLFTFTASKEIDNGGITVPIRLGEGSFDALQDVDSTSSCASAVRLRPDLPLNVSTATITEGCGYDTNFGFDPLRPHPPGRVIAIRGKPLKLRCPIRVSGNSSVKVLETFWIKDLEPLSFKEVRPGENKPRVRLDGRDLYFEKIVHKTQQLQQPPPYSDEGKYECWAKTDKGFVFSPLIHLVVAGFETVEQDNQIEKAVGDWVVVKCPIRSVPKGKVTWTRAIGNGTTTSAEIEGVGGRLKVLASGNLLVGDVKKSDAGSYRCSVRNDVINKDKRWELKLSVVERGGQIGDGRSAPVMLEEYETRHLVLEEEEELKLDCVAFGVPLPKITWLETYRNPNGTAGEPIINIVSDGKKGFARIVLTKWNSTIASNYTCVVANGVGRTLSTLVSVSRHPLLRTQMVSQEVPAAATVRFECPVPDFFTLQWYKDGDQLKVGVARLQSKRNDLVISNTIRNDSGFYQCEVVGDGVLYAVGTARLVVNGSERDDPAAPVEVQCKVLSRRSIQVSWKNTGTHSLSVHYMELGDLERQRVTNYPETSVLIETLKPNTNYSIYVRSYTGKLASSQSATVFCKTWEDVPAKGPALTTMERWGPNTTARVKWKPLGNGEARGLILWYKVQWRMVNGEFANVRYLHGMSDEFLLTDLSPTAQYEVRVIPSTYEGYPVNKDMLPWYPVPLKSSSAGVSESVYEPPLLVVKTMDASTVLLNWTEPDRATSVIAKGFRITYSTFSTFIKDVVYYGPITLIDYVDRDYRITDLDPETVYEFSLQTFGENWESELSTVTIKMPSASTPFEVPEYWAPSITSLRAEPQSASTIKLSWDISPADSAYTGAFTVKYNKLDTEAFQYKTSLTKETFVANLEPYTPYEFVVSSENALNESSSKIESRTLPGLPDIPIALNWKVVNKDIQLNWKAPERLRGNVLRYYVEYAEFDGPTTDRRSWKSVITPTNSAKLTGLDKTKVYEVRVRAETTAGIGEPTGGMLIKLVGKPTPSTTPAPPDMTTVLPASSSEEPFADPPKPSSSPEPTAAPDPGSTSRFQEPAVSNRLLGILIGASIGAFFILVCATIYVFRNRCFGYVSRASNRNTRSQGAYQNGTSQRWKGEPSSGVELKPLQKPAVTGNGDVIVLVTKESHAHMNGSAIRGPNQDGVSDPLLMRIVRNPMEQQQHQNGEPDEYLEANNVNV